MATYINEIIADIRPPALEAIFAGFCSLKSAKIVPREAERITVVIEKQMEIITEIKVMNEFPVNRMLERPTTKIDTIELKSENRTIFEVRIKLGERGDERSIHHLEPSRLMDGNTNLKERVADIYPTKPVFISAIMVNQNGSCTNKGVLLKEIT